MGRSHSGLTRRHRNPMRLAPPKRSFSSKRMVALMDSNGDSSPVQLHLGQPFQLRLQVQQNSVADEVSAITAVVRPILVGLIYTLKRDVVQKAGGAKKISLSLIARLYRPADGDCGISALCTRFTML